MSGQRGLGQGQVPGLLQAPRHSPGVLQRPGLQPPDRSSSLEESEGHDLLKQNVNWPREGELLSSVTIELPI